MNSSHFQFVQLDINYGFEQFIANYIFKLESSYWIRKIDS